MKHKKIIAIILLSIIVVIIIVIIAFLVINSKKNSITELQLGNQTLSLVFSIEYDEQTDKNIVTPRILSMVILFNPTTKKIGVLEIPAYIAINNQDNNLLIPLDQEYRNANYHAYINKLKSLLDNTQIEYIFIKKDQISNFVDLLGGLDIFIISEEFSTTDDAETIFSSGVGNVTFDGENIQEYLYSMENISSNELLKSSKRKELITSILLEIKKNNEYYINAKKIFSKFHSLVLTSLSNDELKKLFLLVSDYQINNLYFQRLNGQLKKINVGANDKIVKDNNNLSTIFFINSDVGNISQVLSLLDQKLVRDSSDRINSKISISILNGTVVNGLASKTKEIYESAGFQVLFVGNANDTNIKTTTIIDRTGNKINSNFAAQLIGVRSIITDITSVDQAGADITLILGQDFNGIFVNAQ